MAAQALGREDLFITLPTRGDHPELLERLLEESGLEPERVVIVRTDPRAMLPQGVVVLDDYGPLNIHRWWNAGIDECERRGARVVAVVNDDIVTSAASLDALVGALSTSGATIASPGPEDRMFRGRLPRSRTLLGSLWLLRVDHGLRPSQSYRWFYGDDDLDIRARGEYYGVVTLPVPFEHLHPSEATEASPVLQGLIVGDKATFRRQHPANYVQRALRDRTQGRTGKFLGRLGRRVTGRSEP